ncbi:MAG: hypothetical protein ACXWWL_00855 [Candidatus Limnocylindria bacterium]
MARFARPRALLCSPFLALLAQLALAALAAAVAAGTGGGDFPV